MTKIDVSTLYRRKLFIFPNIFVDPSRLSSIQIFNNSQSDSHLEAVQEKDFHAVNTVSK